MCEPNLYELIIHNKLVIKVIWKLFLRLWNISIFASIVFHLQITINCDFTHWLTMSLLEFYIYHWDVFIKSIFRHLYQHGHSMESWLCHLCVTFSLNISEPFLMSICGLLKFWKLMRKILSLLRCLTEYVPSSHPHDS